MKQSALAHFAKRSEVPKGAHVLQVARMIMMGIEFTGKVPFSTVFLHGLVGLISPE